MKGVIFNVFEDFVNKNLGEYAWDKVLEDSKTENDVFVGPKTYEDSEFLKLLTSCITLYKLPLDVAVRQFGKFLFPRLVQRAPELVWPYKSPEDLLMNLDGIIHVEVKKLMTDANTPKFNVKRIGDRNVEMEYISKRQLCVLVEGLIEGLGEYYNCTIEYKQNKCFHKGDHCCVFDVKFKARE